MWGEADFSATGEGSAPQRRSGDDIPNSPPVPDFSSLKTWSSQLDRRLNTSRQAY
jgi:hypothetical protein